MKRVCIVDTIPRDARNQGSINLGFEIAKNYLGADAYHFTDRIDRLNYDMIAFNVFYPTHLLNVAPFLIRNGIEPLRADRMRKLDRPSVLIGGQGVGKNNIMGEIADKIHIGEIDKYTNEKHVLSSPVIGTNKKAVIELTRGCRFKCKFCEYSHVWGGRYREKPLQVVRQQLDKVHSRGVRSVNFLSASFGGYSKLDELMDLTQIFGIKVMNTDSCVAHLTRLQPYFKLLPRYIKIGVESFDEKTRERVNKPIADVYLDTITDILCENFSAIHFYLIYGLPLDDYENWFKWIRRLGMKRRSYTKSIRTLFEHNKKINTKDIRMEFNITNFEPCDGTPLSKESPVNFDKKDKFLVKWSRKLTEQGFYKNKERITYATSKGRFGRKENSYRLLMELKKGGVELTEKLIKIFPNGIGRSISDQEAERFLKK